MYEAPPLRPFRGIHVACVFHAIGYRRAGNNSQSPRLVLERERSSCRRMPIPAQVPPGVTPMGVASKEWESKVQGSNAGKLQKILSSDPPMVRCPLRPPQYPQSPLVHQRCPIVLAEEQDMPARDHPTGHPFSLRPAMIPRSHLCPPSASQRNIARP